MHQSTWSEIADQLEAGEIRVASQTPDGDWVVNPEVKNAILQGFREGRLVEQKGFFDKDTLLPRRFSLEDRIRLVPGGSTIRRGAYVAAGVVVMPPAYINVGAYVDEGCIIDSHVLIGSCAQIGKRVHVSAGVQIGGVLEPVGQKPVIIEDDAFIGAGAILVEGVHICRGAVITPSVTLSKSVAIYDAVHQRILPKGASVPAGAVVVAGTRPMQTNAWAKAQQLSVACPVIVKYRNEKTDAALKMEKLLREDPHDNS